MSGLRSMISKDENNVKQVADEIYRTIKEGGLALVPDSIGYGLVGNSEESVKRIYSLKNRPLSKPLTYYMRQDYIRNIAEISADDGRIIDKVVSEVPCCFIVPLKRSAYFDNIDRSAFDLSTKEGSVALFIEDEDTLIQRLLDISLAEDFPLIVSSANLSGHGNIYSFEDIPDEILDGVDLIIRDPEVCRYNTTAWCQDRYLGATIIRLPEKKMKREGVLYSRIRQLIEVEYGKGNKKDQFF